MPTNMNCAGFADESALLKHELAYCLGQIKRTSALPVLESVLRDETENPMVRHEVRTQFTTSIFWTMNTTRTLRQQKRLAQYPQHRRYPSSASTQPTLTGTCARRARLRWPRSSGTIRKKGRRTGGRKTKRRKRVHSAYVHASHFVHT